MEVANSILVVEDEERAQRQIKKLLEEKGYKVIISNSTEVALKILREKSNMIDLILLDIIMPESETGGIELLQKIREMEQAEEIVPRIPVIFVTVKGESEVKDEVARHGKGISYEGILKKPLTAKKIDTLLEWAQTFSKKRAEAVFLSVTETHGMESAEAKEIYNEFIGRVLARTRQGSIASLVERQYLMEIDDLIRLLVDARKAFASKIQRRFFFTDFKAQLKALWEKRGVATSYAAQTIDLVFCAVQFTRPERLKGVSQIDSLLYVVKQLKNLDMGRDDARQCGQVIRQGGFKTLPQIDGDQL